MYQRNRLEIDWSICDMRTAICERSTLRCNRKPNIYKSFRKVLSFHCLQNCHDFCENEKPIYCKVQWRTAQPAHTFKCLCFLQSSEPWKKNRPNLYQVLAIIGECVVTFVSRKDENFTQIRFFKFTIVVADAI